MIEAPVSRMSSGLSALTVAFVPTGMNCGVSTTPWVSAQPTGSSARRSVGRLGTSTVNVSGAGHQARTARAGPVIRLRAMAAGSSHRLGMPGSERRGGGIS